MQALICTVIEEGWNPVVPSFFIGKEDFTTAHEKSHGGFGKEILWMFARK